jgi:hypothetical protein
MFLFRLLLIRIELRSKKLFLLLSCLHIESVSDCLYKDGQHGVKLLDRMLDKETHEGKKVKLLVYSLEYSKL